jgi:hypothetical protein
MEFRKRLLDHIKSEKELIEYYKKDPCRYTELGNNIALENIHEHKIRLKAYEDLLKEIPIMEYRHTLGVTDEEEMTFLAKEKELLEGDVYMSTGGMWKWTEGAWHLIWKRDQGQIYYAAEWVGKIKYLRGSDFQC